MIGAMYHGSVHKLQKKYIDITVVLLLQLHTAVTGGPAVYLLTLFAEFGLSLFDAGDEHVPDSGRRQTVEAAADGVHGDHVQVLSA